MHRTLPVLFPFFVACSTVSAHSSKKPAPTFAELTRDHAVHSGLITLYEGPKELFALIPTDLLGKDLGMMAVRSRGSGGLMLRGMPIDESVVRFERVGYRVVLSRVNTHFTAAPDSPLVAAVKGNFSDSPVFTTEVMTVKGQPPGTLINVTGLFKPGLVDLIDPKLPYKPDDQPTLARVEAGKDAAIIRVAYRLARDRTKKTDHIDTWTRMSEPRRTADGKNVEVLVDFHLFRLPENTYVPRHADARLGGFTLGRKDYTNVDARSTTFSHLLVRWHIQPKDSTERSDAKSPLVFYMDRSIPPRWRPLVRDAALWWNPAFEAAGIRGALEVRDPPDDPDFDHHALDHSMIYWALTDDLMFSGLAGSAYTDPRTGQILKGQAYLNGEFPSFTLRRYLVYAWWRAPQTGESPSAWKRRVEHAGPVRCSFGPSYSSQLAFARLVLKARGHLTHPEAERAFQEAAFKELVAHEIGHALGFHHNFKASLAATADEVRTGKVTPRPDDRPMTASVMDYNPVYIPPKGDMQPNYFIEGVGPYDRLMVEFAYRPLEHLPRDARLRALDAIAARAEIAPGLAFDNGLLSPIDPTSNTDDLGRDPIAFSEERLTMIHNELLPRLPELVLAETQDYATIRQALDAVVFSVALDYVDILARHIGGQILHRMTRPSTSKNAPPPIEVVPAKRQRRALAVLTDRVLGPEAFPTPPKLLNTLKADLQYDWNYPYRLGTNYDVHERIAFVYRAAIKTLLSRSRLTRVLDNEGRIESQDVFTVAELFATLSGAAFGSLDRPLEIPRRQRLLQLELVDAYKKLILNEDAAPAPARQLAMRELDQLRRRVAHARTQHIRQRIRDPYVAAHLVALERDIGRALDARTVLTPRPTSARGRRTR